MKNGSHFCYHGVDTLLSYYLMHCAVDIERKERGISDFHQSHSHRSLNQVFLDVLMARLRLQSLEMLSNE